MSKDVDASGRAPSRAAKTVPSAVRNRPLFVRYLVLAAASALTVAALAAAGFASGVNGAPLAVTVVIVAAGAVVSGYAGVLHWRADALFVSAESVPVPPYPFEWPLEYKLKDLRHQASLVFYAVALFQVLGMIGALLGYRQQTHAASLPDSSAAVKALTLGLGSGLTATLAGVLWSVIVWVLYLHLQHALDKPA